MTAHLPTSRGDLLSLFLVVGVVLSGPLALAVTPAAASHGPPASWQTATVDGSTTAGFSQSVAFDADGTPHVAYHDTSNKDLKYATRSGGSWQTRTVDASGNVGAYASLALDDDGHPHIAYYDATNDDLKYAEWDGSSWQVQTVLSSGDVGAHASLALDDDGHPHVAYYDVGNKDLEYVSHNGVSWITQSVESAGDVGRDASLALDGDGDARIAYYDASSSDLKYAERTNSGWTTATVDAAGSVGWDASIAVDGSGVAHVSYYDASNGDLKYATWDGTAHVQTVDAAGTVGWYSSIALDGGEPHISYFDSSNGELEYVRADGGGWTGGAVATQGQPGEGSAIALDGHDNPLIVHRNGASGDLEVTERRTAPTAPQSLGATAGDGQVSLTWSAPAYDGRAPVQGYDVYRDDGSGLSKIATVSGTSYTDSGLSNGKQYEYVVRATNAVGTGPKSGRVSATPLDEPAAPRSLQGSAGDGQVSLSWSAPSDDGGAAISTYTVYRDDGSGLAAVANVSGTSYTDTGLSNGKQYDYEVTAVNAEGESPASNLASATPQGPPAAPAAFEAHAEGGQVELDWEAPADDGGSGIVDYRVYRGTEPGDVSRIGTVAAGTTSFVDDSADPGQAYVYEVTAVNGEGEGDPASDSAELAAETPGSTATPETTPANESVSVAEGTPVEENEGRAIPQESGEEATPTEHAPGPLPVPPVVAAVLLALLAGLAVGVYQLQQ